MPEIPVAAEAGLFRDLVGDLLREPAKAAEDAADHDLPDLARPAQGAPDPGAGPPHGLDPNAELRQALARGDDPNWVTRHVLAQAGRNGHEAQQILDQYGTKVVFTETGGSTYIHGSNTMYISLANGDAAVGVVHETTHAQWAHGNYGGYGGIGYMSRPDYISSSVHEEVDATTREIYTNMDRQANNPHLNLPDRGLQAQFKDGYAAAAHQADIAAWAQGRQLTPEERAIAGDAGGRQILYNEYMSGRVIGSVTGRPYVDTLGESWDGYPYPRPGYQTPHAGN